jgi:hypothetical protein
MKKLILLLTLVILSTLVLATDEKITFYPETNDKPVVSDVPFDLKIKLNTDGIEIVDVVLEAHLKGMEYNSVLSTPFNLEPKYSVGTDYGYKLITEGAKSTEKSWKSNDLREILNFKVSKFKTVGNKNIEIKNIKLTPIYGDDITISDYTKNIDVQLSKCGDGVVGYFDENNDGIKGNSEPTEVCDANSPGCFECKKIVMGYKAENCDFGSYNCEIIKLTPEELFLEKMDALFNNKCYHDLYCVDNDPVITTKTGLEKNYYMVSQITAALKDYFSPLEN